MRHLDLFSGIGGFALAADRVWPGIEHTFCEIDPFCQAVLKKHWPHATIHEDIKKLVGTPPTDILTGGFPCQPFSNAGLRKGTEDDRHLWPQMLRVIREASPTWIIGENVGGLLTWNGGLVLDTVISDLEAEGYEAWPIVLPACAVDAPHRRDRVWIVAHRDQLGRVYGKSKIQPTEAGQQAQRQSKPGSSKVGSISRQRPAGLQGGPDGRFARWPAEPALGRVAHGVPNRVDRIKSLGNSIVPQVAEEIMRLIKGNDH